MLTDLENLLRLLSKPGVQAALLGPPGPPPNLDFIERGGDHVESDLQLLLNRTKSLLGDILQSRVPLASIRISGPGGVINGPMLVIQRALIEHGYAVEVENDHAPGYEYASEDERKYLQRLRQMNFETHENRSVIQIKMKHEPWGG
jgi:hypothetical protein